MQDNAPNMNDDSPFSHVPVEISVSVGRARPRVGELMELGRDAVLPLDRRIEDPVELWIGDKMIAKGELVELEGDQSGQLAVRLTEVNARGKGL